MSVRGQRKTCDYCGDPSALPFCSADCRDEAAIDYLLSDQALIDLGDDDEVAS